MASTCIRRPGSGRYDYLCQSEAVKPSMVLAVGAELPARLAFQGSGAPDVCPECAAIQVVSAPGDSVGQLQKRAALYARVAREVSGTRQAVSTLQRYVDAGCRPGAAS